MGGSRERARAGVRWDDVVEKVWKDIGRKQEDLMSAEKFGRYKADVEEIIERREKLVLIYNMKSEKRF